MAYVRRETPIVQDLPILFNMDGAQYPFNVNVFGSDIAPDANGKQIVPAGSFVTLTGGYARFLARSIVASAFSTGSPNGQLSLPYNTFKAGDTLYSVEPFGSITIGGTYLASETVSVTISGFNIVVTTGSTDNPTIAATVAAAINADPILGSLVQAIASSAVIYIIGKDGHTAQTLVSAGRNAGNTGASAAGTSTVSASTLQVNTTPLGVIASVDVLGNVTLTGNAAFNLPVGARVGVPFGQLIGVYCHSIDFYTFPSLDIAPCFGNHTGIYTCNLPYIDEDIKRRLNRFVFY